MGTDILVVVALGGAALLGLLYSIRKRKLPLAAVSLAFLALLIWLPWVALDENATITRSDFVLVQLAVFAPIFFWWLLVPSRIWEHPLRKAYLFGFGLLGLSLFIIVWDHPRLGVLGQDGSIPENDFSIAVKDPADLVDVDASVDVIVDYDGDRSTIDLIMSSSYVNTDRKMQLSFVLPQGISGPEQYSTKYSTGSCRSISGIETVVNCDVTLHRTPSGAYLYPDTPLFASFKWKPKAERWRLGESRFIVNLNSSSYSIGQPIPNGATLPPHQLKLKVDPFSKDVEYSGTNPNSAIGGHLSWSLNSDATPEPRQVDVRIVDRQVRLWVDQAPQLLFLAGGLLLGFLVPLSKPQDTEPLPPNVLIQQRAEDSVAERDESLQPGSSKKPEFQRGSEGRKTRAFIASVAALAAFVYLRRRHRSGSER